MTSTDCAARRTAALTGVGHLGVGAILVTDLISLRYLTGFTGSAGALLVTPHDAVLATDGRYTLRAAHEAPDLEVLTTRSGASDLAHRAADHGVSRVGFEDTSLTVADRASLPDVVDWVPVGDAIDHVRSVKDDGEIASLRAACSATDRALQRVFERLRPGVTEREVAAWVDDGLRLFGEGPGFDTIVAAGTWGAEPHHEPLSHVIAAGEMVTIDCGAKVGGYHADMTRTVIVGAPPEPWQTEMHAVVARSQEAGREALHAGVDGVDVDRVARSVIEEGGFGEFFVHGLGHGVGLRIHEAPYLGASSTDKLHAGVVVTVEPGVYVPGRGGVRIEDTLVVHSDHVECLTTTPRDLLVLG